VDVCLGDINNDGLLDIGAAADTGFPGLGIRIYTNDYAVIPMFSNSHIALLTLTILSYLSTAVFCRMRKNLLFK
jgi:hypothetical protein